ncbi:hypothetical protein [Streptomyces sediminimaris]|uniref:hypothetical protein n=1 Tax=Streptomyces sediminimaris TaxID=3383721 RepID=UPI00399973FA
MADVKIPPNADLGAVIREYYAERAQALAAATGGEQPTKPVDNIAAFFKRRADGLRAAQSARIAAGGRA